jgi:hypothetical protein
MTITEESGTIFLREIGASITSTLTRAEFIRTPAFADAAVLVKNEPWCSYFLPEIPLGDTSLSLSIYFHGERLESLNFVHEAERFGVVYKNTLEQEIAREAFHARWLTETMGTPPGRYSWGEIWSGCHPKDGYSSIVIRYR